MLSINNKIWKEFDKTLAEAGDISFWWRDDDVKASKPVFCKSNFKSNSRLKNTLSLLQKYNIPGVFAVIPDKFIENGVSQIKLLKHYKTLVVVHGIKHENNNASGPQCEFPANCDNEKALKDICDYKTKLENIFGNLLLPAFVPPYNSINSALEEKLLSNGFHIVSKNNTSKEDKPYNVDVDFMNWQIYKMREVQDILEEVIDLIKRGKTVIGFNNHHRYINTFNRLFFHKLLKTLAKHNNIKWIMPF